MLISFLNRAVMQGIPLLYGSTGEIISQKAGNMNLGIPGTMYVGAISGVIGAFLYENSLDDKALMNPILSVLIPILCCIVGSTLMGLIYSFLTVTLKANQNVTGLALTTFGIGVGNYFGGSLIKLVDTEVPSITLSSTSNFFSTKLPFADKLGWFGELFLSYSFLAYLSIIIAIIASLILTKTRLGLNLRSVGENPATADAAGINVTRIKYGATCVGSVIAGLGGLYYIMDYADGIWSNDAFGDRGWLAIALVIFALWRPNLSIFGSIIFGGLLILHNIAYEYLTIDPNTQELFKMTPYLVTIIVLVIVSARKKRENQPPQSLGLTYFREER